MNKQIVLLLLLFSLPALAHAQWMDGGRKQSQPVKGNGALIVHEGTMYFWNEENHFQISTDNGATWSDPPDSIQGANPHVTRISAAGGRIYAALNFGTGNGVPIYSEDQGVTWKPDTLGAPGHALGWGGRPVVSNIYAWGRWVYVKWDQPNTPHHIKAFDSAFVPNMHMAAGGNNPSSVIAKGDTLFAAGTKVYYTVDGGATWVTPANNGYSGFGATLYLDGHRLYMFAYRSFTEPCYLYYSDDNAENWTEVDITSLTNRKIINGDRYYPMAAFIRGNRIEFSTAQEKFNTPPNVWRSTDLGATWEQDTVGLPTGFATSVNAFAYTPDGTLWAVRSHENIYRQKIAGGSSSVATAAGPDAFMLEESYPNPFSSATTVDYRLLERCHVTLTVCDLQGRRVATLVDGMEEAGRKQAQWDASGMADGIYLLRLQAGSHVATREIMLVR